MTKILIIEDNPMTLDLMTYLLKAAGYIVVAAKSAGEGLQMALEQTPDLILCDLYMRGDMNGFDVGKQLKHHPLLCSIPLIAVTFYTGVGDKELILEKGFDGYIPKPVLPRTFAKEVEVFMISETSLQ